MQSPPEGQGGFAQKVRDTAAERDELKVANAALVEALKSMLFAAVLAEYGLRAAQGLADNNWFWPDDAPRLIKPGLEQARATLKEHGDKS